MKKMVLFLLVGLLALNSFVKAENDSASNQSNLTIANESESFENASNVSVNIDIEIGSAEEFAGFFAEDGEVVTLEDFKYKGLQYWLVYLDGVETVFLTDTKDGIKVVEDEKLAKTLSEVFVLDSFNASDYSIKLLNINYSFSQMGDTQGCIDVIPFLGMRIKGVYPFFFIYYFRNSDYKVEWDAYVVLNESAPKMQIYLNSTNDSIKTLGMAIEENNYDKSISALGEINQNMSGLKSVYPSVSSSYFTIIPDFPTAFYKNGKKYTCEYTTQLSSSVDSILAESDVSSLQTSTSLFELVTARTEERTPLALAKMVSAAQASELEEVKVLLDSVNLAYANASNNRVELESLLAELKFLSDYQASTQGQATNSTQLTVTDFSKRLTQLKALVQVYNITYPLYVGTITAVNKADKAVNNAKQRFGDGDERIIGLQKELTEVKLSLSSAEGNIKNGLLSKVSFANLTKGALELEQNASSVIPKENQLDLVTIGGIVLLLVAAVGSVIYFRRKKSGKPLEIGLKPGETKFAQEIGKKPEEKKI